MDLLTLYFACGAINTLLALLALHQQGKLPVGLHRLLALLLGMALWPLTLLALWYERQVQTYHTPQPEAQHWKHQRERSGKYTFGRLTVIMKWRPRQVISKGPYTILLRPRLTLDAPILLGQQYVVLTPLCCQLTIFKRPKHLCGFTLVELLLVILITGILMAALIPHLFGARRVAQHQRAKEFTASCMMTAEKHRSFLSNTLMLPATCAELGLTLPANVKSATFTRNGDHYDLKVVAMNGHQSETLHERLAVRAK